MKEYQRETIQKIISKINVSIFLPDIQRPFEWEKDRIYKLFDSLMREYPINTFLFWQLSRVDMECLEQETGAKLKMYRFVDRNDLPDNLEEVNRSQSEYTLVLDGQQRLTSLYIALKGVWIEKFRKKTIVRELYFDVLSGEGEDDNGIAYAFKFRNKDHGLAFLEDSGDEKNKRQRIWVNIKQMYEYPGIGKSAGRKEFLKKLSEAVPEAGRENEIDDRISDFIDVLTDDGVVSYFPVDDRNYDRVLDIFVRTNSGGLKLGYSDLLFSKLKLGWDRAREEFNALLQEINFNNLEFDTDLILKTCLTLFARKLDDLKYNPTNISKDFVRKVRDNWEPISHSIRLTVDLMKSFLISDKKMLPSYNALIPVTYWLHKVGRKAYKDDASEDAREKEIIRTWLVQALLTGVFGGQGDSVLFKCKEAIDIQGNGNFPAKAIVASINSMKGRSMDLKPDRIDTYQYGSKESYLFLSVCYKGAINFQPLIKARLPEQDHILSKKELEGHHQSEKINSIFNIRFVSGLDNRSKGGSTYAEWLARLGDLKARVLATHLIPDGQWDYHNFDKFIENRRKMMMATILGI